MTSARWPRDQDVLYTAANGLLFPFLQFNCTKVAEMTNATMTLVFCLELSDDARARWHLGPRSSYDLYDSTPVDLHGRCLIGDVWPQGSRRIGTVGTGSPKQATASRSFCSLASYYCTMAHAESPSTLASVFELKHKKSVSSWSESKLEECYPYSRLHAKYWGKTMAIEEQEWTQPMPGWLLPVRFSA
jgi:hypothetical protein